ncbi:MAG: peptidylprolyl isomerase [Gammaproteobacteria bacterium]
MKVKLTTSSGDITIELNEEKAPETVKNFVTYVESGHYDGTIFHRVINNFMIQGGGHLPDMSQKKCNDPVKNEADNGLQNKIGTIAMARTSDPHSASAQFFINVADNDFLNFTSATSSGWGYCVFGEVTEGMDVVNQIKEVATAAQDVPVEEVLISKAEVVD